MHLLRRTDTDAIIDDSLSSADWVTAGTVVVGSLVLVVADIDARTTVLDAFDGRHVRIPNRTVIGTTIANLTRRPRRRLAKRRRTS